MTASPSCMSRVGTASTWSVTTAPRASPWEPYVTSGSGGLSWPEGLTFDPDRHLPVRGEHRLEPDPQVQRPDRGLRWVSGPAPGSSGPRDVKFGPDGLMYVASAGNNRILRFTASGTYVDDYVPAGSGGMTDLQSPGLRPRRRLVRERHRSRRQPDLPLRHRIRGALHGLALEHRTRCR